MTPAERYCYDPRHGTPCPQPCPVCVDEGCDLDAPPWDDEPPPRYYDEPCDDPACIAQACPEHLRHNCGDHTYEQHHDPADHCGPGPCRCPVYA